MRIQNITDMIGNTPLVRVNDKVKYYAKIEGSNLFGSVKDRAARYLMENAYNDGIIKNDTVIIESSSGNFGIALAGMCKIKGNPISEQEMGFFIHRKGYMKFRTFFRISRISKALFP